MKVIITIPAYNEEKTIAKVVADIKKQLKNADYEWQVMVYNDGSVDKTISEAKKAGALVFSNRKNSGLAYTFGKEIEKAIELNADIIVHTDADGQYPAEYIPKLIEKIRQGNDLVLGSRFIKNKYSGSVLKNIGNRMFSRAISSLTKQKITDSTTGFRAFTSEVAKEIEFINTFTYTQEQIIRAAKQKFRIAEIPIHTAKTRPSRLFKGPFEYAFKAWVNILRIYRDYNPLRFFGSLGMLFITFGFVLGIWILITLFNTGSVGGIPRVILCALFIIAGIQTILFGFLADMLKK